MRAIPKTTELFVTDPTGIARRIEIEDSLRLYTSRMREAGLITSTPQQIIAKGTDWRFLDEVKRELKA
ncbi:MAG TPA: hypothetical protein VE687_05300 [Stellaceae bacterium]|nr:hypothetical protein [Stellaceae bacterium]